MSFEIGQIKISETASWKLSDTEKSQQAVGSIRQQPVARITKQVVSQLRVDQRRAVINGEGWKKYFPT